MDDEVGDNDEEMNALHDDLDELLSWADSFCADAISSDFVKEASPCGFICKSSEITSASTSGKVAGFGIREEQRELQGLKSKSGGTEIVTSAAIKTTMRRHGRGRSNGAWTDLPPPPPTEPAPPKSLPLPSSFDSQFFCPRSLHIGVRQGALPKSQGGAGSCSFAVELITTGFGKSRYCHCKLDGIFPRQAKHETGRILWARGICWISSWGVRVYARLDPTSLNISTERAQDHFLSPWSKSGAFYTKEPRCSLCVHYVSARFEKTCCCWCFEKIANFFLELLASIGINDIVVRKK
jgi:hypothetical protein